MIGKMLYISSSIKTFHARKKMVLYNNSQIDCNAKETLVSKKKKEMRNLMASKTILNFKDSSPEGHIKISEFSHYHGSNTILLSCSLCSRALIFGSQCSHAEVVAASILCHFSTCFSNFKFIFLALKTKAKNSPSISNITFIYFSSQ